MIRLMYWYILIDSLNRNSTDETNAVLGAVRDPVIARQLHKGIMDSELISTYYGEHFEPDSKVFTGIREYQFCEFPKEMITPAIEKKRQLVQARLPGFIMWKRNLFSGYVALKDSMYDDELYLASVIEKSSPENPSPGLVDYAEMAEMSIPEAYEYLKLSTQEMINKRIILNAIAEKVARRLNKCVTAEEVAHVCERMKQDFLGRNSKRVRI